MHKQKLSLVWFKRDLRLTDHQPLKSAIESGRQLLLFYCFCPEIIANPHYDLRHWRFIWESLEDINQQLSSRQNQIEVFYTNPKDLFLTLSDQYQIEDLYSHEESGLKITYDLDKWVAKYCTQKGIHWYKYMCNGVLRGAKNRQNWLKHWHGFMKTEYKDPDLNQLNTIELDHSFRQKFGKPIPQEFKRYSPLFQKGGRSTGLKYMSSFLTDRIKNYSNHISKPEQSRRSCSRLSPYLAWGNLSIREVYQARFQVKEEYGFKKPSSNFGSRLQWHDHFVQKFEMEDRYEFENINRGYDLLKKEAQPGVVSSLERWGNRNSTGRCLHEMFAPNRICQF